MKFNKFQYNERLNPYPLEYWFNLHLCLPRERNNTNNEEREEKKKNRKRGKFFIPWTFFGRDRDQDLIQGAALTASCTRDIKRL